MDETALITLLRGARRADDVVGRLREGSLEARRDKIAEAVADPEWVAGPAQLINTYHRHAIVEKNGTLMRVEIMDEDGTLALGKVEVFQVETPVNDIGAEVMETAEAAVDMIMLEDYEGATPLVASIANALSYKGDLKLQIETELARRSVQRTAWWHQVVRERMGEKGLIAGLATLDETDLAASVEALKIAVTETAATAQEAIKKLGEDDDVLPEIEEAAKDIAADLKYAIQALTGVDREDAAAMRGVFEGVNSTAGFLYLGAQFLKGLAEGVAAEAPAAVVVIGSSGVPVTLTGGADNAPAETNESTNAPANESEEAA